MVKSQIYFGIENSFQLLDSETRNNVRMSDIWLDLINRYAHKYFKTSEYNKEKTKGAGAIRTKVGSTIVSNGDLPEVATPPVRVRRGFTSEVADNLYLARKELLDFIKGDPDLRLIGYATHWNLSDWPARQSRRDEVMAVMAVPFSLFTLTPISIGINLRYCPEKSDRFELLGDYLEDEDQIRAFSLFYAATVLGFDENRKSLPVVRQIPSSERDLTNLRNRVTDGRYSRITVVTRDTDKSMRVSAQAYMQVLYEYFKPGIEQIGTSEEVENLEDFVYGRKLLEVDKVKRYKQIDKLKGRFGKGGWNLSLDYHPDLCVDPELYADEREMPNPLAKLMAGFATGKFDPLRTIYLTWRVAILKYGLRGYGFGGIDELGALAAHLEQVDLGDNPYAVKDEIIRVSKRFNELASDDIKLMETIASMTSFAFEDLGNVKGSNILNPTARLNTIDEALGKYDSGKDNSSLTY